METWHKDSKKKGERTMLDKQEKDKLKQLICMYLNLKQVLAEEELLTSGNLVLTMSPQPGILVLQLLVISGLTNRY
jgi:hypothetical protein